MYSRSTVCFRFIERWSASRAVSTCAGTRSTFIVLSVKISALVNRCFPSGSSSIFSIEVSRGARISSANALIFVRLLRCPCFFIKPSYALFRRLWSAFSSSSEHPFFCAAVTSFSRSSMPHMAFMRGSELPVNGTALRFSA